MEVKIRMSIKIIDISDYLKYKEAISFIHNMACDEIEILWHKIPCHLENKDLLLLELNKLYSSYCAIFPSNEYDFEMWVITGEIAEKILKDMPVHGCTIIYEKEIICVITWAKDLLILKRVFLHELCHSYRMRKKGIDSYSKYVKYLDNPVNFLYEEMLAMATEKKFFQYLSWEEAAGFEYNKYLTSFEMASLCSEVNSIDDIKKVLNECGQDINSCIYYMAYYLSKMVSLDKELEKFMDYSSEEGLNILFKYHK